MKTFAGVARAEESGFRASGLAQALGAVQPDGSMTREAANQILASMYVAKQVEADFSKYYDRYVRKFNTALGVEENFNRDMQGYYQREKERLTHALTPKEIVVEENGKKVKKSVAPVDLVRDDPRKAAEFERRYKSPGLARYVIGG